MVLSMTGFGRSEGVFEGKKITVEVKSLNSKTFDMNIKIPLRYKEKEFEIRRMLNDLLYRGKVDCYVGYEQISEQNDVKINTQLIKGYMKQLKECATDAPEFEYLKMAVRMPDAISSQPEEIGENESEFLLDLIKKTAEKMIEFRQEEGQTLQTELLKNIEAIRTFLAEVAPFEEGRIHNLRQRYQQALQEYEGGIDETRFYQEMAYFAEKLDVSEEKVRLTQHLDYFQEVLRNESCNGKKLGFIAQEMGREINTLGSKANHAEIQKLVVKMKDELEKIKEQALNIL